MEKLVMNRRAADNEYLHKDFHGAMSYAIEYLSTTFGPEAVREYLTKFAKSYYAPLTAMLNERGLMALKEHFERIYSIEGGDVEISLNGNELTVKVNKCPAVSHLRDNGRFVSGLFHETTAAVNEAICDGTPFAAKLIGYDLADGSGVQMFYRRDAQ